VLWGDPHIRVFDSDTPPAVDIYNAGDYWIVLSPSISIQARYLPTQYTNGQAATDSLAVGGPFMQNHTLVIESLVGQVLWDGEPILESIPSEFNKEGFLRARYHDDSEGGSLDPGQGHLSLRSVEVVFPHGFHLVVNRWPQHIDVMITMRPQSGGQDGHCGNFNGKASDDTTELIKERMGTQVPAAASLFPTKLNAETFGLQTARDMKLEDCAPEVLAKAKQVCAQVSDNLLNTGSIFAESCVFDVCFGGEEYAVEDAVVDRQATSA